MKKCQVCQRDLLTKVTKCNNLICSKTCASFYTRWGHIIRRCTKPNHPRFHDYGGRGVGVCDSWMKFSSFRDDMFTSFIESTLVHGLLNTTIERVDNNRGYCRDNCIWETRTRQNQNRRKVQKQCSSEHIGVNWHAPSRRWVARITVYKNRLFLGAFKSEEDAATYYNVARQLFFTGTGIM